MKVTITIEDDGEGIDWGPPPTPPPAEGPRIRGRTSRPYIRGPYIVIPRDDGTETEVHIDGLAAAAEERKPQARRPSRPTLARCATSAAWVRLATFSLPRMLET